jgi:hypothetical protein
VVQITINRNNGNSNDGNDGNTQLKNQLNGRLVPIQEHLKITTKES